MGHTLLAITMSYKISDKILTNIIATGEDLLALENLKNTLSQEVMCLKSDLKKKLVVLTGRYHNMLYGTVGASHSHNFEQTPSNYYSELQNIEDMLISKYDTIAKYFKSKDISKLYKVSSFKIIEIKD